jgi:hypothetical protein
VWGKEEDGAEGGEMTQTLYAHMNKRKNLKLKKKSKHNHRKWFLPFFPVLICSLAPTL